MTTRSAAACVERSEKLGAAPTPAPAAEAGRLLQRLAASESRREKAESRLRMTLASSAGVASAAVEGAREGLGNRWPPPRRMVAADLVTLEAGLEVGFETG